MHVFRIKLLLSAILALGTVSLLSSCSNDFNAALRKLTYPPDFKYVSTDELRSTMAQFAYQLQVLDGALLNQAIDPVSQQQQVLMALSNLKHIGANIQGFDAGASHPFLQDYMQDFVSHVDQARVAASLDTPSYYLAGRLSGACMNCHKINRL